MRPRLAALLAAVVLLFPLLRGVERAARAEYDRLLAAVDDDAFYYLLPAHRLAREGLPSFDGRHPTYGFQPLWFVLLTGAAALTPERETLLRVSLAACAALHALAGALLWFWLRRGRRAAGRAAVLLVIAAGWAVSHDMIALTAKAKENALHAAVLAALLLRLPAGRRAPPATAARAAVDGVLLGLLVLTRMNAFPMVAAWLGIRWLLVDRGAAARARLRLAGATLAGAVLTALPWLLASHAWFGTVWPTSGSAKTAGLDLAAAAGNLLSVDFLRSLSVFAEPFAAGLLWVSAALAASAFLPGRAALRPRARLRRFAPALLFLAAYAAFTHASTFALLRPYFEYATWYRVPQHLLSVALVALLLPALPRPPALRRWLPVAAVIAVLWVALYLAAGPRFPAAWHTLTGTLCPWLTHGLRGHLLPLVAVSLALGWGLCLLRGVTAGRAARVHGLTGAALVLAATQAGAQAVYRAEAEPRVFTETPGTTNSDMLVAVRWSRANLPDGAVLAGANCGLPGYALERHPVINLDGLANSPDFLAIRRDPAALAAYLEREGVTHLIDVFQDPPREGRYFGAIPASRTRALHRSPHLIPHWGGCRVMVLALDPAAQADGGAAEAELQAWYMRMVQSAKPQS